jgi:hypothetical protein
MTDISPCKWDASRHKGKPCPYHGALSAMIRASQNNDYAAYEKAKQEAEQNEGVDQDSGFSKLKQAFFKKKEPDAEPLQDINNIDAVAQNAFTYDKNKAPGLMDGARLVEGIGDTVIYDTGYTAQREGVVYHNGEEACTREEMVETIDRLFLEGKQLQAEGLKNDLDAVDDYKNDVNGLSALSGLLKNPETLQNLVNLVEERQFEVADTTEATTSFHEKLANETDFDAEIITSNEGLVKTFSTSGGSLYSKNRIRLTPQEMEQIDEAMVERLSQNNERYKQNIITAMKKTSDQDTREEIAMYLIHAVEFDKAVDSYPAGPYRNMLKAEASGMLQYASRWAKYTQSHKYSDESSTFLETRIGDLHRYDNQGGDRADRFTVEEKITSNGVTRQIDVSASGYDDELWGQYFEESKKHFS